MVLRREAAFLVIAAFLAAAGGAYAYFSRATTLTLALAPSGGTEPALLKAFADTLQKRDKDIRLTLKPFDGVRESAEALRAGKVDLAVVRPDVAMPENGLTLAILREQAVLVAAPDSAGIKAIPDLARKRLGFLAPRGADLSLITELLERDGLAILASAPTKMPPKSVALIGLEEDALAQAFTEKRIDAVILLTTPTSPAAKRLVGIVQESSKNRKVSLVGIPDVPALTERMPKLQAVTVPAALFGSSPKIPGRMSPRSAPPTA